MPLLFGIKFAPVIVPLERRLQTLAVATWFIFMTSSSFMGFMLCVYLLLYTRFYIPTLIYIFWTWYDKGIAEKGGRRLSWVRKLTWWKYFYNYFPINLVKTVELPTDRNYLFASYPHGMLCSGVFGNFATDASNFSSLFPGLKPYVLTLNTHFVMPFSREIILGLGAVTASKESILYLLDEDESVGKALILMVGGARESYACKPGRYKIILKNRKGFVKLSLKTGTSLVPVFSFGETDLYDQVENPPGSWLFWLQEIIRNISGIAPCIPIGRGLFQYSFGLMPRRHSVTTVVGKPIDVVKSENPSSEEIDKLHTLFCKELTNLFETYKHKYVSNPEKVKLEIE
ncbi:2-acylglycerol O-acyltransferase 2-A [Nilaparvata lugens]|uniref:2-acylglycerol O-acyltransferase 2-A n=1 Tax=Nilaparvata lugens TaxID=108931 RepID=UPI000B988541|nr:2-acylglycerol O-acyltransferase 2-A [Nilaparvata lugens]